MKKCISYFVLLLILFSISCSKDHEDYQEVVPNDMTQREIEHMLQDNTGNDAANINSMISSLKSNENVDKVFASADNMQVIIKFKNEDCYSVYPIHLPADPFEDTNLSASRESTEPGQSTRASSLKYDYKETGSNGVVAVFDYFSNSHYGNDKWGSRTTQNMLLDYMCRELNSHDYGVEFYGYDDMTLKTLLSVKNNASKYKAVVIISHGFSEGNQSYFLIGEEYNAAKAYSDQFLKDEGFDLPFSYKFWNNGLYGLKERYDFAVPVKKMDFGSNVLLYMGSCDAYKYNSDMKGKCVGWDGTNSCAQAHVALLFHKLLRGKNLYDALDIDDTQNAYYSFTKAQTDTWQEDLVYKNTHLKHTSLGGGLIQTLWAKKKPFFYKNGDVMPLIRVYDSDDNFIIKGICTMKDHTFKLKFASYDALPSDYVWIKATPLRADVAPIIKKVKTSKLNKGFKIELEANGVYELSAAIDEDFNTEILLHKPVVFVYAKPFKENSIPLGDGEEDDDDDYEAYLNCPNGDHPHMIDLGLPSGTLWACCNVGASKPEDYGSYYAWGETQPKDVYDWSTYIHCVNGIYQTCQDIGSDIAGTEYDTATANWGAPWCMPTLAQYQEFYNNCTSVWATQNGVKGYKFTGPNGRSIFLPATGYYMDPPYGWQYGEVASTLWSSTVGSFGIDAYALYFHKNINRLEVGECLRVCGSSVRPVVSSGSGMSRGMSRDWYLTSR